jgi:hypothetical protein
MNVIGLLLVGVIGILAIGLGGAILAVLTAHIDQENDIY